MCLRLILRSVSRMACVLLLLGAFPSVLACGDPELFPENALTFPASAAARPFVVSSWEQSAPEPRPASLSEPAAGSRAIQIDVRAVVVRVIDGDSLVVDIPSFPPIVGSKITVRIAGCDTPERRDRRPEIRELAQQAKALTARLAPVGSLVWLRDIRRDKYFRLLARVETVDGDIGEALLRQGLAAPYDGGKKAAW